MADTKISALTAASAAALANELPINEAGTSKKVTGQQLVDLATKRAAGTTMAAGLYESWLVLSAASSSISSPTLVTVMEMTAVDVGRYQFDCQLVYQTTATTTGINVGVTHTGTLTQFLQEATFISTGSTAATKAASNADQATTLGLVEGEGNRTKDTAIGTSGNFIISVDAANTNMIVKISGYFVVSVTGSFQIKLGSESGVLVCTAREGSSLILRKLS